MRRSQGGDDSPENLLRLCLDCHEWVHSNPKDAYEVGYLVRSWQTPAEVEVARPDVEHEHTGKCVQCGLPIKKTPRKKFQGEARRKRKTISLRVPDDAGEDGAGLLTDGIENVEESINPGKHRPPYYTLMDCVSFTLLNADATDLSS